MCGKDCKITLCDMESGSSSHILQFHSNPILSLAWSPYCEHVLASGDEGGTILLWDVRRAMGPLACLDQHNGSGRSASAGTLVHIYTCACMWIYAHTRTHIFICTCAHNNVTYGRIGYKVGFINECFFLRLHAQGFLKLL